MSVTQDYKTFTFTQAEVDEMVLACGRRLKSIAEQTSVYLAYGEHARFDKLMARGEILLAASEKLVRK